MNYKHFTIEECCYLRKYYVKGNSYRKIAKLLGRKVSSVSKELRRNCHFTEIFRDIIHIRRRRRATFDDHIVNMECFW